MCGNGVYSQSIVELIKSKSCPALPGMSAPVRSLVYPKMKAKMRTKTTDTTVGERGVPPRGDASWHALRRYDLKREVVHRDGRGLRVLDDIYQSSQTEVVGDSGSVYRPSCCRSSDWIV